MAGNLITVFNKGAKLCFGRITINNSMLFDLKKAQIYKAARFAQSPIWGMTRFWRIILLILGGMGAGGFVVARIFEYASSQSIAMFGVQNLTMAGFLCWTYIFLPLGFSALFLEIFFNHHLKYPKITDEENLANLLDFDSAMVLNRTASPADLLASIVSYRSARRIFIRLGVDPASFEKHLAQNQETNPPDSEKLATLVNDANELRLKHGGERITITDLLASLFDYNEIFKRLMIDAGLDKNDLESLSVWYEADAVLRRKRKEFWRLENLLRKPPIGIGWIYGYSWYLNRYATDITRQFREGQAEVKLIGRQRTVDQMEQVLARSGQNNILLVGEPGVGKRTVIMGFAQMIAEGKAVPSLNYKRVFELNVPLVTSSSKDITEVQNTLIALLNESAKAGNIVLVIEDFHNFVGALDGMGRVDISELLIPYLESSGIQVIATTDPVSFHKHIESRAEIIKVFEKIEVNESSAAETQKIVQELVPMMEGRFGLLLTYGAIKKIVEASDRYITSAPFPEKAIDLLTDVASRAKSLKKSVILPQDIDETVMLKTDIPLGKVAGDEKEKLINLESEMHREIIGQNEAVRAIAQTMQRLRAGLAKRGKPAGVFLFVGPTGVGKTLTAKILAKTYFGSPEKMIRFDMSEYQDAESLDRFLGALRINEPGQLASKVRDEPFSVILLDEIEKAHKNILNIFLAIFDEGRMTDVFGRKANFEQNIIIATSNAAADLIRDMVNQGLDPSAQKDKIIDALVNGHYFSPEFLNRFDQIVIFHPLDQEQLYKIPELLITGLAERLREQGYLFKPTPEIIGYISKIGFDPQFGARPMQRAVQDKLETVIARKILEGSIQKGVEFSLTVDEVMA